jgi:site-specific DNA-methyltransferase (adenine-specific)
MSTFLSIGVHIRIWLAGLRLPIKNCIVWDKKNMGMGWQYRYQHEFIIMAVKGTKNVRRIRTRSQTDVWQIPRIPGNQTIHPTEKPIDMMKRIIENSEEGEYVVDFFAGSGVVPDAAESMNRRWDAFEIDPGWYTVSTKRMEKTPT